MNIHPVPTPGRLPCGRRGHAGFTLIELMIAMILGLVVIAGVASVFLAGQRSFRTNDALSEVQDSSRVAFELMARDIRDAGLTGCSNQGGIVNVLNNKGTTWWANFANNAVHGYDDATTDQALTDFAGPGAPVAGTSSLELISAANSNYSVQAPSGDTFTLNETNATLATGDIVVICDPSQAAILQIGGYTPGNATFTYAAGGGSPLNGSTNLDYQAPGYTVRPFGANSLVALYEPVDWYIGTNPVGGGSTSLYRVSLKNVGGVPTAKAQEMVRNVTGMTLTYLNPTTSSAFVDASLITDWSGVTAVRAQLTLQSTFNRATTDAKPVVRQYAFTTTLRNRVN